MMRSANPSPTVPAATGTADTVAFGEGGGKEEKEKDRKKRG